MPVRGRVAEKLSPSKAPAARPRLRLRAPERREQILRAAAECFGTRGFRGTTTRDVAAAVGITEAALYRHFPGKEAIYAAILDKRIAEPDLVAHLDADARAGDEHAVFFGLALRLLEAVEADPSFLRLLLYSALEGHEMARPFQDARIRHFRAFLAEYIDRRTHERAFRRIEPMLAARAFLGMVLGHLIVRQVFGQRDARDPSTKVVAETFASIFLDGLRARKPAPRLHPTGTRRLRPRRRHG
jgi:AcrR family transcriptional regulator